MPQSPEDPIAPHGASPSAAAESPAIIDGSGIVERFVQGPAGMRLRVARQDATGLPVRGTVLLVQGRTEMVEKYAEQMQDWAARGFCALTFDWRGQGLSDRYGGVGRAGHVPDFGHYLDDLDAVVNHIAAQARLPRPLIVFGHSMGGHVTLRWLAERDPPFAAAILSAPMTGIATGLAPPMLVRAVAAAMVRMGQAERYAPGNGDPDPANAAFESNPVSTDPTRWAVQRDAFLARPELAVGGVTWGWLDAAHRSIATLTRAGSIERIRVPVLVIAPMQDAIVPVAGQILMAHRLPHGQLVRLDGSQHEPFMERDAIRDQAWAAVDGFLRDIL